MSKRIAPLTSAAAVAEPDTLPATSLIAVLEPPPATDNHSKASPSVRKQRTGAPSTSSRHFAAVPAEDHASNRQAEMFYLQKQIQLQTQMVFILEDGARVQGIIEWYDRCSIKVRGKSRLLIYKAAIKYLYKAGEVGSGSGE